MLSIRWSTGFVCALLTGDAGLSSSSTSIFVSLYVQIWFQILVFIYSHCLVLSSANITHAKLWLGMQEEFSTKLIY